MVDYSKSKHVNVLDFGADPTGTKDSAPAIQNAINSVAAVPGGGSVEIPSGIYLVSNDFINLRDRVEVYGHGFSTQIIGFNKNPKILRDVDGDDMECQGYFIWGHTIPLWVIWEQIYQCVLGYGICLFVPPILIF